MSSKREPCHWSRLVTRRKRDEKSVQLTRWLSWYMKNYEKSVQLTRWLSWCYFIYFGARIMMASMASLLFSPRDGIFMGKSSTGAPWWKHVKAEARRGVKPGTSVGQCWASFFRNLTAGNTKLIPNFSQSSYIWGAVWAKTRTQPCLLRTLMICDVRRGSETR